MPPTTSASDDPSKTVSSVLGAGTRDALALGVCLALLRQIRSMNTIPSAACLAQISRFLLFIKPKSDAVKHPSRQHFLLAILTTPVTLCEAQNSFCFAPYQAKARGLEATWVGTSIRDNVDHCVRGMLGTSHSRFGAHWTV